MDDNMKEYTNEEQQNNMMVNIPSMSPTATSSFPLGIYQEGCISVGQVLKLAKTYKGWNH